MRFKTVSSHSQAMKWNLSHSILQWTRTSQCQGLNVLSVSIDRKRWFQLSPYWEMTVLFKYAYHKQSIASRPVRGVWVDNLWRRRWIKDWCVLHACMHAQKHTSYTRCHYTLRLIFTVYHIRANVSCSSDLGQFRISNLRLPRTQRIKCVNYTVSQACNHFVLKISVELLSKGKCTY